MVKKNFTLLTREEKKSLIDTNHQKLSIVTQAKLLKLSRSTIYYVPKIKKEELKIMHALDKVYMKYPFYGSRRLRFVLKDEYDIHVNRKCVQRLMRLMGIQAIYPKPKTTIVCGNNNIYPYLLKNMPIIRPNQVWSTDITYIPLEKGFCYLTVILDWFSRYVLAWELSETMETVFCTRALKSALSRAIPEIHNSDQGSQFTSKEYTELLTKNNICISMDGRGRCLDNIFTERLWRSVKYEDIYLKHYRTMTETFEGLKQYFLFYNAQRRHQSLQYKTPEEIYRGEENNKKQTETKKHPI
jgi:putative transposase